MNIKAEIKELVINLHTEMESMVEEQSRLLSEDEKMYFEGSIDAFEHIITLLEISLSRN